MPEGKQGRCSGPLVGQKREQKLLSRPGKCPPGPRMA